jgi:hypothetical protein
MRTAFDSIAARRHDADALLAREVARRIAGS